MQHHLVGSPSPSHSTSRSPSIAVPSTSTRKPWPSPISTPINTWDVCPLRDHFQRPRTKLRIVQNRRVFHSVLILKFNVRKTLWLACVLVTHNCYSINCSTICEVGPKFFNGCAVVNLVWEAQLGM